MPDLNELLRWSIANSTKPTETASPGSEDQQLQLRFNPASGSTSTSNNGVGGARSALHSSDLAPADLSPASTPGPNTPTGENLPLPVPGAKRDDLTTEMLDLIMGKSDSIIMKEKMEYALDGNNSVESRVEALDDFEMLIELIDNANNMPILKLWEPLLSLLKSEHEEIVAHALWIIGTAVQNNLKAQAALYIHNAIPLILSLIFPATHTSAVRAKATYALSSALKHWPLASTVLSQTGSSSSSETETGYTILKKGISDSDLVIKRKMSFLLGTLIMQSGEVYQGEIPNEVRNYIEEQNKSSSTSSISLIDGLKQADIYTALLEGVKSGGDIEFEENSFRALIRALQKGALGNDEIEELKAVWEKWGKDGREGRGFEGDDAQEVLTALRL